MPNTQQLVWDMVGPTFWLGYSIVCGIAAVLWFRFILRTRQRDALTTARLIMLGGFILGAFVRLNSACEPLSAALLATGGAFSALLISTNWCGRRGSAWDKVLQMVREFGYGRQPDYSEMPRRRR